VLAANTFIGSRVDLQHYAGLPIHDYELEIVDQDDDAYDLSTLSDFTFEIFAKPHGKSLTSFSLNEPVDNIIILNHIHNDIFLGLRAALYHYEVYAFNDDSPTQKVIINYGVFELI
jgi:hypothetical protein